ncbi:hypothetical protein EM308_11940 [Flavobacterium gilvum]|uniref:Signal transduction histidine kinase internal region domain-containing protein n=2 Tax=Flavobacterium gilvum TaxID=1492737 RepID=A0AAC9I8L3_9FLAO|nr:hypothetical protein EM308_11940 [Flavobacterium gilvum]KFC59447.1 hypothetical protein FEM08_17760 [Flavobacterium gilvum]
MKAFKKFCLLTIIPLLIISIVSIILSGSFANLKVWRINAAIFEIFVSISFGYVYVFEKRQQKKEDTIRNLLISALFIFTSVFCFISFSNKLFLSQNNFQVVFLQTLFAVSIFFLEFLIFFIYLSKTNELVLDEKPMFYLKLVLGISLLEFVVVFILTALPIHQNFNVHLFFLSLKTLSTCLILTTIAFLVIFGICNFPFFRQHYLITTLTASLISCYFKGMIINFYPISLFSSSAIVVVMLYSNKLKNDYFKIKSLTNSFSKKEAEYQQLKNQVNPHFLFNNLNTLISFIEINPKKAVEFGHHLSNTYRHYLKNQNDDFVLLKEELEFIKEYLEIYKAKFENAFTFEINVLPKENEYILSLSLQEIIDNIFKHNSMEEDSPLKIKILTSSNGLLLENSVSNKVTDQSNQVGLQNINKRYKILTNKEIQIVSDQSMFQVNIPILILEA